MINQASAHLLVGGGLRGLRGRGLRVLDIPRMADRLAHRLAVGLAHCLADGFAVDLAVRLAMPVDCIEWVGWGVLSDPPARTSPSGVGPVNSMHIPTTWMCGCISAAASGNKRCSMHTVNIHPQPACTASTSMRGIHAPHIPAAPSCSTDEWRDCTKEWDGIAWSADGSQHMHYEEEGWGLEYRIDTLGDSMRWKTTLSI
jgi:hypothetical protein